jgi:Na+-transporting NADH:ubiquinone oxidoreductase subunit NqrC
VLFPRKIKVYATVILIVLIFVCSILLSDFYVGLHRKQLKLHEEEVKHLSDPNDLGLCP